MNGGGGGGEKAGWGGMLATGAGFIMRWDKMRKLNWLKFTF